MSELRSDGVLSTPAHGSWSLQRWDPPADLAGVVGCAWATQWMLPSGRSHTQGVLPHPVANLTLEHEQLRFYGPARRRFDHILTGSGRVIGIRFRPGMLRHLTGMAGQRLVDHIFPGDIIGVHVTREVLKPATTTVVEDTIAHLFALLADVLDAAPAPPAVETRDAVELIEQDHTLRSVEDLAVRLHRSSRTLQRQFK